MTLLGTQTKTDLEAAEGRFFMLSGGEIVTDTRTRILEIADRILQMASQSSQEEIGSEVSKLEEQTEFMQASLRQLSCVPGLFEICFPNRFTSHSNAYNSLLKSYSVNSEEGSHRVLIPSDELDTCQVLPYPNGEGYTYNPVVNMRVKTPYDDVVQVFNLDVGGLVDLPNVGRWYHFPLNAVEVGFVELEEGI